VLPNRLAALSGWSQCLSAFGVGLLAGLAQAPFDLPILYLIAIPALYLLISQTTARRALTIGWWAGLWFRPAPRRLLLRLVSL